MEGRSKWKTLAPEHPVVKSVSVGLLTRGKLRNIKKGKKKDSKWRKTKEGEVQKASGHNVLCVPETQFS